MARDGTGSPTADSYMILRVTYGAVFLVIPPNASAPDKAALVAAGPVAANVLVLPHHGANKTDLPFIEAVNPAVGLVPVGSGRYAPSPGPAIIDWFGGRLLLRTDVHGRITIRTDGHGFATVPGGSVPLPTNRPPDTGKRHRCAS